MDKNENDNQQWIIHDNNNVKKEQQLIMDNKIMIKRNIRIEEGILNFVVLKFYRICVNQHQNKYIMMTVIK